jgi:hypothetical protein
MMTSEERMQRSHDLGQSMGEEMGAICWSYAALVHLGLEPNVVFHEEGYQGSSATFIRNFSEGNYVAVPLLQWMGLTLDTKQAREQGVPPYPAMLRWLRE